MKVLAIFLLVTSAFAQSTINEDVPSPEVESEIASAAASNTMVVLETPTQSPTDTSYEPIFSFDLAPYNMALEIVADALEKLADTTEPLNIPLPLVGPGYYLQIQVKSPKNSGGASVPFSQINAVSIEGGQAPPMTEVDIILPGESVAHQTIIIPANTAYESESYTGIPLSGTEEEHPLTNPGVSAPEHLPSVQPQTNEPVSSSPSLTTIEENEQSQLALESSSASGIISSVFEQLASNGEFDSQESGFLAIGTIGFSHHHESSRNGIPTTSQGLVPPSSDSALSWPTGESKPSISVNLVLPSSTILSGSQLASDMAPSSLTHLPTISGFASTGVKSFTSSSSLDDSEYETPLSAVEPSVDISPILGGSSAMSSLAGSSSHGSEESSNISPSGSSSSLETLIMSSSESPSSPLKPTAPLSFTSPTLIQPSESSLVSSSFGGSSAIRFTPLLPSDMSMSMGMDIDMSESSAESEEMPLSGLESSDDEGILTMASAPLPFPPFGAPQQNQNGAMEPMLSKISSIPMSPSSMPSNMEGPLKLGTGGASMIETVDMVQASNEEALESSIGHILHSVIEDYKTESIPKAAVGFALIHPRLQEQQQPTLA